MFHLFHILIDNALYMVRQIIARMSGQVISVRQNVLFPELLLNEFR